MTAKEKLREAVERFSEREARDALRYLAQRHDPLIEFLDAAPEGDEPLAAEDEECLRQRSSRSSPRSRSR